MTTRTDHADPGRRRLLRGAGAFAVSAGGVLIPAPAALAGGDEVVDTTSGRVRGRFDRGLLVFKGVPYGETTASAARFLPPRPYAARAGVLEAADYGATAPQLGAAREPPQGEDCLVLNIWTRAARRGRKVPVMVHIHGGGFRTGSGSGAIYDGRNIVQASDIVMVSLNHRLGPMGYLYLGDVLGGEYETGNAGNLDLVLALRWVRDNIEAFGGDPGRVTVFGVSGGGKKISHLLAMPAAQGLFHRAVIQSGALSTAIERPAASAYTERLLSKLGVGRKDVRALQALPAETILQAAAELTAAGQDPDGGYGGGGGPQPLVDGRSLPRHPGEALAAGMSGDIPVIIGSALDEPVAGFARPGGLEQMTSMTNEQLRATLMNGGPFVALGERTDEVIAHYRKVWPAISNGALLVRIQAAGSWRLLSNILADRKSAGGQAPVWVYVLTFAGGAAGVRGAGHGDDTRLVMRNIGPDSDWAAQGWFAASPGVGAVSDRMSRAWVAMAESGDPNHPGLPPWPRYTRQERATMLFDMLPRVVNDPFGDSRAFAPDLA